MRTVRWYEWVSKQIPRKLERTLKGEAIFHQFGTDTESADVGIFTFSTAIIELPDGSIKNVPVEMIEFVLPIIAEGK
jgi:hypothetical protein